MSRSRRRLARRTRLTGLLAGCLVPALAAPASAQASYEHQDSLTDYQPSSATASQDVRPRAAQRGVFFDGSMRSGNVQGWIAGRMQRPESWNARAKLSGSVMLDTGTQAMTDVHLSLPANVPWVVGTSYNGRQQTSGGADRDSDGPQGRNWFQLSQPELIFVDKSGDADDMVYIVYGADRFLAFVRVMSEGSPTDQFEGVNGTAGVVEYTSGSPDTYTYYDRSGKETVFFGGNTSSSRADWQIWKISDADGNTAYVGDETSASTAVSSGYTSGGNIDTAYDSTGRAFAYTYSSVGGSNVLTKVVATDGGTEVGRVEYDYYVDADTYGNDRDLRSVTITTPMSESGVDQVREKYFRYWSGGYDADTNPGHDHLLQYIIGYEGVRQFDWSDQTFDRDHLTAGSGTLKEYASAYFEYDSARRIDKAWFNGDCGCSGANNGTHELSYEADDDFTSTSGYDEEWADRAVVERPDGTFVTQYFDETGGPLSRVVTDSDPAGSPSRTWGTRVVRDASGFVEAIHTPANLSGYTHDDSGAQQDDGGTLNSKSGSGLIRKFDRFSSGATEGYLRELQEREGTGGTLYVTGERGYETLSRTIGSADVKRVFPVDRVTLDARVNASTYSTPTLEVDGTVTAHSGSGQELMPKEIELQRIAVSSGENGDGNTDTSHRYLRPDGTPVFQETTDGIFTYTEFTEGQLTKRVVDEDLSGSFPAGDDPDSDFGIVVPAGTSEFEQTTTMTYDDQGRREKTTRPDGRVSEVHRTVLADRRQVTISVPRVESGSTFHGPASIRITDHAGNTTFAGTIGLSGGSTTSALDTWIDDSKSDPIAALGVGTLSSVTTRLYDDAGAQMTESRTYTDLPSSMPGSDGTNYDATTYGYDDMGRRTRVKQPTGTITRTEYDELGRSIERWVGTNDSSFPNGSQSGTDDMVKTSATEYDNGNDGGNSHVTKRTAFVVDGTTDKRVTNYTNDERGRPVIIENPQPPHTLKAYDNENRVTATASYSSTSNLALGDDPETESSNRLSLSTTHYDARGQVWKTERFKIDQSTGAKVAGAQNDIRLVTLNWYDGRGRTIKTVGRQITKMDYDRLGRTTHRYTIASTDDASYADAEDVAGDIVLREQQTIHADDSSNVLARATIDRYETDYGGSETTGALDTNADSDAEKWTAADLEGRIQITAMWYDAQDRLTDRVRFGTYGGSDFDRTDSGFDTPPARSDSALRTTIAYDDHGRRWKTTDPEGIETRVSYDDAGREIKTVENYVDGTPGGGTHAAEDKTVKRVYTDGLQTKLIADLPGSQTDQETVYTFGVDKGGDSEFSHGGLLAEVAYPDSTGGSDVATYAYNAQGQEIRTEDQAGNVIGTEYDTAGRVTHKRVTSLDADFDGQVRRISRTYTDRGRLETVEQYDNATVGSGSVVNAVEQEYDAWSNLDTFAQDHDSAVTGSGNYYYDITYTWSEANERSTSDHYRNLRRTGMTMPNGDAVDYVFSSASDLHDDEANRVTSVELESVAVATYDYLGTGNVVETYLDEAEVYSSVTGSSAGSYPGLDDFNRIATSSWSWDLASTSDQDLYSVSPSRDRNGWIERVENNAFDRLTVDYTNDDLGRLAEADRGLLSGGSITKNNYNDAWDLGQTGNWALHQLDLNGDGDTTDAGELDEDNPLSGGSAHFNEANELLARDTDDDGSDDFTLAYDETGNMTDDGEHYEYVYDAFGRLRKIKDRANGDLVAEYEYNGLDQRISWRYDSTRSGGGKPDGVVDASDPVFHFVHNERWQLVATYRNTDSDPKEQFLHHNAGLAGRGSSSYIDHVILRDDHDADWTAAADSTLDRRVYHCQNWRADVVALLDASGAVVERVRYGPYGTPQAGSPADLTGPNNSGSDLYAVPDGDADTDDDNYYQDAYNNSNADIADISGGSADGRPDGSVTSADFLYWIDLLSAAETLGRNRLSRSDLRNRRGYAGYAWDPALEAATPAYHVRNRVLMPGTGRWSRRDPIQDAIRSSPKGLMEGLPRFFTAKDHQRRPAANTLPISAFSKAAIEVRAIPENYPAAQLANINLEYLDGVNKYAYARHAPHVYTDPQGLIIGCAICLFKCGGSYGDAYDCGNKKREKIRDCYEDHMGDELERSTCIQDVRENFMPRCLAKAVEAAGDCGECILACHPIAKKFKVKPLLEPEDEAAGEQTLVEY